MSAQRLECATHAVVRFVPVAAEADTLLRVCQRLVELVQLQEAGATVAASTAAYQPCCSTAKCAGAKLQLH